MGAGNPTISGETETQVWAACQPRQPHTSMTEKFTEGKPWMSFKCGKKCSNLLVMQEMQIITSMIIIHFTAIRMAKIKQKITTKYWKNVGGHKFLCILLV